MLYVQGGLCRDRAQNVACDLRRDFDSRESNALRCPPMTLKRRLGSQDLFLRTSDPDETRRTARRRALLSLGLLLIDVLCSTVLLLSLNGWQLHRDGRGSLFRFRTNAGDALLLSLARLIVLPCLALCAVRLGTPPSLSGGSEAVALAEALLSEPLLAGVHGETAEGVAEEGGAPVETVEELKAAAVLYERCKARRGVVLALLFICCTVLSVVRFPLRRPGSCAMSTSHSLF